MHQVNGKSYSLEHIDIEINHECNLNCMHCSASAGTEKSDNALNTEEIENILRSAKYMGLIRVGLTGGEPLMDLDKLFTVSHMCRDQLGLPLHIHTNGTLVTQEMVRTAGILTLFEAISVTFLGANAQAHDEVTRQTGSFESALRSTQILVDAGLPLTCFFVPIHNRFDSFDSLVEKLTDLGVEKIRALALAPSGRARSIFSEAVPNRNEIAQLERVLQEARKHYGICIEAGYCTRLLIRQLTVLSRHEKCTSGLNRLHINCEGNVFPCTAASGVEELKIGNVRESELNLEVLWQESPKLNVIRSVHSGLLPECEECSQEPKCRDGCMVNTCGTMDEKLQIHCPLLI